MAKEEKKQDRWIPQMQIIDEDRPPKAVIVDNETNEVYTTTAALAKILNNLEELKGLL